MIIVITPFFVVDEVGKKYSLKKLLQRESGKVSAETAVRGLPGFNLIRSRWCIVF